MPKAAKTPVRTHLSVEDMKELTKRGETVLINGEAIHAEDDLPDEVDMALTGMASEDAVRSTIDAQIEALQSQKERLAEGAAKRAQALEKARLAAAEANEEDTEGEGEESHPTRRRGRRARAEAEGEE
jgi:hypothetical protein